MTNADARRRVRRILLLTLPLDLLIAGVLLLGLWPSSSDAPPAGVQTNAPGDGGLRRPLPPMPTRPDNPVTPKRVALGRLLYFDPVLSGANDESCATCHHPDLGLSDGRGLSMGRGGKGLGPERTGGTELRRSAPTVWNAAYNPRQFWDGRASDLEDQAGKPIESKDEMNQDPAELVKELRAIPEYVALFDQAFAGQAGSAVTFDNTTRALAAFERTLVSTRSRFDRYREGEVTALSASERRGLALFRSLKTRCFECHGFPTFANPDFKVVGVPDLPGQKPDLGREEAGAGPAYARAFKIPTLRNVALTAPYMHNGKYKTLQEVVLFYQKGGGAGEGLELKNLDDKIRRFALTEDEQKDLIAFMGSLTDESALPETPERVPSGLPVVPRLRKEAKASPLAVTPAPAAVSRSATVWTVEPGQSIQAALDQARPGDTIEVEPGTYKEQVLVDIDNITLRGKKNGDARAVLDGDNELTDAVIASGHGFTIEGFAVRNYTSNGITVHGATKVAFKDLDVANTGLYGVYPVECKDVLVNAIVSQVPPGTGIFIMGADRTEVSGNEIRGNDSFGVAVVSLKQAFPKGATFDVGPTPEGNWIHGNTLEGNGTKPTASVKAAGGGGDLVWDGSGSDNRWEQPGVKAVPPFLPSKAWPDLCAKAWSRVVSTLSGWL